MSTEFMAIHEFCERFMISQPNFRVMLAAGNGPALIKFGRRKYLISAAAIEQWRRAHEAAVEAV